MQQNNQNQEQILRSFIHKDLVQFKHVKENILLTDTNIDSQKGITVSAQEVSNPNTVWVLEKYCPPFSLYKSPNYNNTEIIQGDLIKIRSFSSNYYLTFHPKEKSPTTKQGLVVLMKQLDNEFKKGEQIFIIQANENQQIRIINIATNWALHSHKSQLKGFQGAHEVTGFHERDDNDYWQMQFLPKELREEIHFEYIPQPLHRNGQSVRSQDKIVLRNCFTGGTLHSHSLQYKYGTPSQEVTWWPQPRDENDWWQIFKINNTTSNSQLSNFIINKQTITLFHVNTKQYLTHIDGTVVKKGDYFQVSCNKQGKDEEFEIEILDNDDNETKLFTENPFRIKHVPTGQYLGILERPSSQTTTQGEVVLTKQSDWRSVWMVEQIDSIYA